MGRDHYTVGTGTVATASQGDLTLKNFISGWTIEETAGAASTVNVRDSLIQASAPTAADGAAGNSTAGLHMFGYTWLTAYGESDIVSFVELTSAGSKIMTVTLAAHSLSPPNPASWLTSPVVGRNIYQTKAGAPGTGVTPTNAQWFLVTGVGLSTTAPSTTIAAGSNLLPLPQATINVAAVTDFKPVTNGKILVTTSSGIQVVSYTAQGATSFTGCSGGSGIMATGGAVTAAVLADNTSTSFTANLADGSLGTVVPPKYNKSGPIVAPISLAALQQATDPLPNVIELRYGGGVVVETLTGTTRWRVSGK